MSEDAQIGDLVWAKMKGFPPWPARVVEPPGDIRRPNKKAMHCIFFFGSDNYAWLEGHNIKPYLPNKDSLVRPHKTGEYKLALEAIDKYVEEHPECLEVSYRENSVDPFDQLSDKERKYKKESGAKLVHKRVNSEGKHSGNPKKRRPSIESKSSSISISSMANSPPFNNHVMTPRKGIAVENLLSRPTHISRPDTPPLDVHSISDILKTKNIQPSTLKFGFLGLGIMGSGIVKNLLNSGHHVTVWNRCPEKCTDFVKAGAEQALTPSDVISAADITLSCVSDPIVAKGIVFGNCGVVNEITASKGYVEMTSIDAETSQDIAEAINNKGGRYLEAQIQGSKTQAEEGSLVVLAAGDRSLFGDCQSCFRAMSLSSFYVGEVGSASKMNLVLQLVNGVALAGLAEGMALADRAGLSQKDVLEILELTPISSKLLAEKGRAIIEGKFPTHMPLAHMQKDLKLALAMGDQLEIPLYLTGTANEVYKHAKRIGYSEHDVSAVYVRARF